MMHRICPSGPMMPEITESGAKSVYFVHTKRSAGASHEVKSFVRCDDELLMISLLKYFWLLSSNQAAIIDYSDSASLAEVSIVLKASIF